MADTTGREATLRRWLAEHRGILLRISRAYAARPGEDSKVSTFVYQVALNTAITRRRAGARRPEPAPCGRLNREGR